MTPTQKVALWERVNAYAEVCGGDTSEGAVGADRQRAVVALESEIECFERKAGAPSWLGDAAEALGEVRREDGAPLALNWHQALEAIRDTREECDKLKRELGGLCVSVRAANDSMERMERDLYLKMQVVEDDRDDWKLKAEQSESPAMRELREMVAMPDGEASAVLAAVVDTVARLREALETIRYEASGLIAKAGSPRYDPRVEYGATDSLYDDGHEDGVVAAADKLRTIAEYAIAPYLAKDGKIAFDPQAEAIRRRPDQEPR